MLSIFLSTIWILGLLSLVWPRGFRMLLLLLGDRMESWELSEAREWEREFWLLWLRLEYRLFWELMRT
jgi:hypothetical protein